MGRNFFLPIRFLRSTRGFWPVLKLVPYCGCEELPCGLLLPELLLLPWGLVLVLLLPWGLVLVLLLPCGLVLLPELLPLEEPMPLLSVVEELELL
jgi:hypothetical protein